MPPAQAERNQRGESGPRPRPVRDLRNPPRRERGKIERQLSIVESREGRGPAPKAMLATIVIAGPRLCRSPLGLGEVLGHAAMRPRRRGLS